MWPPSCSSSSNDAPSINAIAASMEDITSSVLLNVAGTSCYYHHSHINNETDNDYQNSTYVNENQASEEEEGIYENGDQRFDSTTTLNDDIEDDFDESEMINDNLAIPEQNEIIIEGHQCNNGCQSEQKRKQSKKSHSNKNVDVIRSHEPIIACSLLAESEEEKLLHQIQEKETYVYWIKQYQGACDNKVIQNWDWNVSQWYNESLRPENNNIGVIVKSMSESASILERVSVHDYQLMSNSLICSEALVESLWEQKSVLDSLFDADRGPLYRLARESIFPQDRRQDNHLSRTGEKLKEISSYTNLLDSLTERNSDNTSDCQDAKTMPLIIDILGSKNVWPDFIFAELRHQINKNQDDRAHSKFISERIKCLGIPSISNGKSSTTIHQHRKKYAYTVVPGLQLKKDVLEIETISTIASFIEIMSTSAPIEVKLATADGGLKIGRDPETGQHLENYQELFNSRTLLSEVLLAMKVLSEGGNFVVKIFDNFTTFTVSLIWHLTLFFKEVAILKPYRSRPVNSERYVVCLRRLASSATEKFQKQLEEIYRLWSLYPSPDSWCPKSLVPLNILLSDQQFILHMRSMTEELCQRQIVSLRVVNNQVSITQGNSQLRHSRHRRCRRIQHQTSQETLELCASHVGHHVRQGNCGKKDNCARRQVMQQSNSQPTANKVKYDHQKQGQRHYLSMRCSNHQQLEKLQQQGTGNYNYPNKHDPQQRQQRQQRQSRLGDIPYNRNLDQHQRKYSNNKNINNNNHNNQNYSHCHYPLSQYDLGQKSPSTSSSVKQIHAMHESNNNDSINISDEVVAYPQIIRHVNQYNDCERNQLKKNSLYSNLTSQFFYRQPNGKNIRSHYNSIRPNCLTYEHLTLPKTAPTNQIEPSFNALLESIGVANVHIETNSTSNSAASLITRPMGSYREAVQNDNRQKSIDNLIPHEQESAIVDAQSNISTVPLSSDADGASLLKSVLNVRCNNRNQQTSCQQQDKQSEGSTILSTEGCPNLTHFSPPYRSNSYLYSERKQRQKRLHGSTWTNKENREHSNASRQQNQQQYYLTNSNKKGIKEQQYDRLLDCSNIDTSNHSLENNGGVATAVPYHINEELLSAEELKLFEEIIASQPTKQKSVPLVDWTTNPKAIYTATTTNVDPGPATPRFNVPKTTLATTVATQTTLPLASTSIRLPASSRELPNRAIRISNDLVQGSVIFGRTPPSYDSFGTMTFMPTNKLIATGMPVQHQ